MSVTFVLLFPMGALSLRFARTKIPVKVHACWQIVAFMIALIGMGLGIWLGLRVRYLDYLHSILGFAVLGCLVVQALLGALGHAKFKRLGKRSWWGVSHTWWGRGVIALALVNGGLGLLLADNTTGGRVAYGVVAGISVVVYVVVLALYYLKGRSSKKTAETERFEK